ncbi:hypothetical protein DSL72_000603 [Monilinia vaccinii-corymbosi]|uniref:Caleosin domain-containing protein n=1 Tax=Monilinia vaccinii-corymbosi TaxID=61207 RepID=A0A8A3P208_9HELO|nr:hypothetical protein DSL72_000603 [Monilinia vaccinii-corymbosi]
MSLPPTPPLEPDRILFFTNHCGDIITRVLPADRHTKVCRTTIEIGMEESLSEEIEFECIGNIVGQGIQEGRENKQNCLNIMAPAAMENGSTRGSGFQTAIKECPVTEERLPFMEKGKKVLRDPGTARANEAASTEAPNGTEKDDYAERNKHLTVLQQHVNFFDRDQDGIIYPLDTYTSMRRLTYPIWFSVLAMLIIHANFSYPTLPPGHWLPDPLFRIYTGRIHKDKHGSDSGAYDNEGRFIPQKFEDIFSKYAGGDKQGITLGEVWDYLKGQSVIMDPVGWGGALFEWSATWILLWPEDGRMKKEDIRRIYDGSLFYEIAARNEKNKSQ